MMSSWEENLRSNARLSPAADGNESCPPIVSSFISVPSGFVLQTFPSALTNAMRPFVPHDGNSPQLSSVTFFSTPASVTTYSFVDGVQLSGPRVYAIRLSPG